MAISREDVLHVAHLARLALTEEEVVRFQEQLSAILEAVSKVSELDLVLGQLQARAPRDVEHFLACDCHRPILPKA